MNLWGKASAFTVVEVIQFLQANQKTGALEYSTPNEKLTLEFYEGNIVSGDHSRKNRRRELLAGKDVSDREILCGAIAQEISEIILELLEWKEGTFIFAPGRIDSPQKLEELRAQIILPNEMRTEFLLMEALRLQDERQEKNKKDRLAKKTFHLDRSVLEYLFHVHFNRRTQRIEIQSEERQRTFFFENGELVLVLSNLASENLGAILVRKGKLTQERLDEIDALMEKTKKRQGELLVELKILTAFEIFEHLKEQMSQKILSCLRESAAQASEEDYDIRALSLQKFSIDLFRVMVESFSSDPKETLAALGPFYLSVTPEGRAYLQSRVLLPVELKVLHMLNGGRTCQEIFSAFPDAADKVSQLVDFLGSVHFLTFSKHPHATS